MTSQRQPLTDYQWATISPFFDLRRKRKHGLRQMVDAILWLPRTGCQWRNLFPDWPDWQAVYYCFDRWKAKGTLEQTNVALNQRHAELTGSSQRQTRSLPSALCIDSKSVKLSTRIDSCSGTHLHKRVNKRKRTFDVDIQGRLYVVDQDDSY